MSEARQPLLYESFERYYIPSFPYNDRPAVLPLSIHPRNGGDIDNWLICPWGELVEPSLNTEYAYKGTYSLKMAYRFPTGGNETNISRVYENPNLDWTGYNAVRFWLKPDNTGRGFLFMVLPQYRTAWFPDGTAEKEFYFCTIPLSGNQPLLVTMPFSCFSGPGTLKGGPVNETAFWIGKGKRGSGAIFIDHIEVICVADDAVVEAVPLNEPPHLTRACPLRINAGSSRPLIDKQDNTWIADNDFFCGGDTLDFGDIAISGGDDRRLYCSQRIDPEGYILPLPEGTYLVRLHFAELDIRCNAPGKRVFRIKAGDNDLGAVDIFSETGVLACALTKEARVTAGKEGLNIRFETIAGVPALAGIEVFPM